MTITQEGIDLIKRRESFQPRAYQDTGGVWTIGYGATWWEDGSPVRPGQTIGTDRAEKLLRHHVQIFANGVKKHLKRQLNPQQFSALVSFAFNVGLGNFAKSGLLKLVNSNPQAKQIENEFNKWVFDNGKKLEGLVQRRRDEAALYFSGFFLNSPTGSGRYGFFGFLRSLFLPS